MLRRSRTEDPLTRFSLMEISSNICLLMPKNSYKSKTGNDIYSFVHRRVKSILFRYLKAGIPHRRGYLLHGPPGTGKSEEWLNTIIYSF